MEKYANFHSWIQWPWSWCVRIADWVWLDLFSHPSSVCTWNVIPCHEIRSLTFCNLYRTIFTSILQIVLSDSCQSIEVLTWGHCLLLDQEDLTGDPAIQAWFRQASCIMLNSPWFFSFICFRGYLALPIHHGIPWLTRYIREMPIHSMTYRNTFFTAQYLIGNSLIKADILV